MTKPADKQDDKEILETYSRILYILKTQKTIPSKSDAESMYAWMITDHIHKNFVLKAPPTPPKQHSTVEELADWIIHTPSYTQADLETQILSYFQQTVLEARLDEAETLGAFNGRMKTKVTKDSLWSHGYNDAVAEWKAHTKTRLTDLKAKQERN